MSDKFELRYELHEAGWATARLQHGDICVEMTASYLHDSLCELANAAYSLSRGPAEARVVFMDEPGEHQLTFVRGPSDQCQYSVRWFNDWDSWGIRTLPGSHHVCDGIVPVRRLWCNRFPPFVVHSCDVWGSRV